MGLERSQAGAPEARLSNPLPVQTSSALSGYHSSLLAVLPIFTGTLQKQKLAVKTLLSIGGGRWDQNVFSRMVSSSETRAAFINSTIEVARKYGFNGVDLDWEFPADEQDMISGFRDGQIIPGRAIRKNMDWVSPMCFDYHGSWENFTGKQSALYDSRSNISTSYGISSWIRAGVPPQKLVMGLPLYGRTWTLQNPNVNGVGAPAVGTGPGDGALTYSQIADFNLQNHTTVKFDEESVSYYSYVGVSWIGYDDVRSVRRKVRFARSWGSGGYFFWALGQDKKSLKSLGSPMNWERLFAACD
ncbi:hypothetical protein NL676_035175 [Syzygium grande]|nr:hypothetical protein NL676_035175 [Syzygium grande]